MGNKPSLKENSAKLDRMLRITENLAHENLVLNLDFTKGLTPQMSHYVREILFDLYRQVKKAVTENYAYNGDGTFPISIDGVKYERQDASRLISEAYFESMMGGNPIKPLKKTKRKKRKQSN